MFGFPDSDPEPECGLRFSVRSHSCRLQGLCLPASTNKTTKLWHQLFQRSRQEWVTSAPLTTRVNFELNFSNPVNVPLIRSFFMSLHQISNDVQLKKRLKCDSLTNEWTALAVLLLTIEPHSPAGSTTGWRSSLSLSQLEGHGSDFMLHQISFKSASEFKQKRVAFWFCAQIFLGTLAL